jgi:lysozyme
VQEAFGRLPVLYVTGDAVHRYLDGAPARGSVLAGHRLWVRSIIGAPGGGCSRWAFWQFADRGRVDGVDGPVDLDVYCGDEAALKREFG